MRFIITIFSILILSSCTNCNNRNENSLKQEEIQKNDKLISFRNYTIKDMNKINSLPQKTRESLRDYKKFHFDSDSIYLIKDTLYISYLSYVNECGSYDGDIEIHDDTLFLRIKDISEINCMSERIDRFIFKIYNPEHRKYKLVKDW